MDTLIRGPPQLRCHTRLEDPEIEGGSGIGNAGLALLIDKDSAGGINFVGQLNPSNHRVISSMWTHMSPTMPFPYSINARASRGGEPGCYKAACEQDQSRHRNPASQAARYQADFPSRACGRPTSDFESSPSNEVFLPRPGEACYGRPTWTTRLLWRAAASMALPSRTSRLIGF